MAVRGRLTGNLDRDTAHNGRSEMMDQPVGHPCTAEDSCRQGSEAELRSQGVTPDIWDREAAGVVLRREKLRV